MRNARETKLKKLFAVMLIMALCVLLVAAAYDLAIKVNYVVSTATDDFTLDDTSYYYGGYAAGTHNITVNRSHTEGFSYVNAVDLVVFGNEDIAVTGETPSQTETLESGVAKIYSALDITSGTASVSVTSAYAFKLAVLPAGDDAGVYTHQNVYVKDFFELQMCNVQEKMLGGHMKTNSLTEYKNIFFLQDITTDRDFTIDVPCYINLLYSKLILGGNLTLAHSYAGSFAVENVRTLDGGNVIPKIISSDGARTFSVSLPNGYLRTANADFGSTVTLSVVKQSTNFSDRNNSVQLAAMLADSLDFAKEHIPDVVTGNFELPPHFPGFEVNYSYTFANSLITDGGAVTRAASNAAETVTVTATYTGTANYAGVVKTASSTKNVTILGTSDDSVAAYIHDKVISHVEANVTVTDGDVTLTRSIDVLDTVEQALKAVQYGNVRQSAILTISGGSSASFVYGNDHFSAFTAVLNESNVVTVNGTVIPSDEAKVLLSPARYIKDGDLLTITVAVGEASEETDYVLTGMSESEILSYLEGYIETPYFASSEATNNLLYLNEGEIFRGDEESAIINSTLGFTDIEYGVYEVNTADYNTLAAYFTDNDFAAIKTFIDVTLNPQTNLTVTDLTTNFTYENGIFALSPEFTDTMRLATGRTLLLVQKYFKTPSDYYETFRQIVIPESGLGGEDYTEFVNNTFSNYFTNLTLINSTADTTAGQPDPKAERFYSSMAAVKLYMEITTQGVGDYCRLVRLNGATYYQIDIDIDAIPARNTTVTLIAVFYLADDFISGYNPDDPDVTYISRQEYSFIIPGIYRCGVGKEFLDRNFYDAVINYEVNGERVYRSYTDGDNTYLGVESSSAEVDCFTVTSASLSAQGETVTSVDVTGIEYLSSTRAFDVRGVTLSGLDSLGTEGFGTEVISLTLKNCGITNATLKDNLLTMTSLVSVDLEGNSVTSLLYNGESILYRTVRSLNLSNQTGLSDLKGIERLNELTTADVSGNVIGDFRPLLDLERLTNVKIYTDMACAQLSNKEAGDDNDYYGVTGKANIPVFVALTHKGVAIYADYADQAAVWTTSDIDHGEYIGSLILNAVIIPSAYYDTDRNTAPLEDFPLSVPYLTTGSATNYALVKEYYIQNMTAVAITAVAYGSEMDFLVSVQYGYEKYENDVLVAVTKEVYRLFTVIYRYA